MAKFMVTDENVKEVEEALAVYHRNRFVCYGCGKVFYRGMISLILDQKPGTPTCISTFCSQCAKQCHCDNTYKGWYAPCREHEHEKCHETQEHVDKKQKTDS